MNYINPNVLTLTNSGREALARAMNGETLTFTRIAIGDNKTSSSGDGLLIVTPGNGSAQTGTETLTALNNERVSVDIETSQRDGDTLILSGSIPFPTEVAIAGIMRNSSFQWVETGVFGKFGNEDEILIAYCKDEDGDLIDLDSDAVERTIYINIAISHQASVAITLSQRSEIDWSKVYNKPTAFPPEGHEHVWNDISGKPDTFPPGTHTHTLADISDAAGLSGKRTARLVIGTSTAGWTNDNCDYLCDGENDEAEFSSAVAALPDAGGEIVVLDGTYQISSDVEINKSYVTLRGSRAARLVIGGDAQIKITGTHTVVCGFYIEYSVAAVSFQAAYCILRDVWFSDSSGAAADGTSSNGAVTTNLSSVFFRCEDCYFLNCARALNIETIMSLIANNMFHDSYIGTCLSSSLWSGNIAAGNCTEPNWSDSANYIDGGNLNIKLPFGISGSGVSPDDDGAFIFETVAPTFTRCSCSISIANVARAVGTTGNTFGVPCTDEESTLSFTGDASDDTVTFNHVYTSFDGEMVNRVELKITVTRQKMVATFLVNYTDGENTHTAYVPLTGETSYELVFI